MGQPAKHKRLKGKKNINKRLSGRTVKMILITCSDHLNGQDPQAGPEFYNTTSITREQLSMSALLLNNKP